MNFNLTIRTTLRSLPLLTISGILLANPFRLAGTDLFAFQSFSYSVPQNSNLTNSASCEEFDGIEIESNNGELRPIQFDSLPKMIQQKARNEFPDHPLMNVEISSEGGKTIYHVMFEVDGSEAGLKLDTNGRILDRWHFNGEENVEHHFEPSHENIKYGPYERNVLDLWLVDSDDPTPILICIHGGGFSGGDKRGIQADGELLQPILDAGVSIAAINYRLTEGGKNPFPIPMQDGARAIQFLRYHAKKYNLDTKKFGATGGSAGGCMLMWLGFHPDLAQPDHKDPVLRESTRLQALAPFGGQSSLHLPTLNKWFGVKSLKIHPAYGPLFKVDIDGDIHWTEKFNQDMIKASPITYLTHDDPPIYLGYGDENQSVDANSSPNIWVHHPVMGIKLKEAMDKLGIECHVEYPGSPAHPKYDSQMDFMIQKLTKLKH